MSEIVYHLVGAAEWAVVEAAALYRPASLEVEGFIHFSTAEQVPGTSLRYYSDARDLLLVGVAVERLGRELRWEDLVGTGEFPHLYGPLPLRAVVSVVPYTPGDSVG
ncbi:MAG: DUF952 domain-containing protein [Acidimicrobiales bacterium]